MLLRLSKHVNIAAAYADIWIYLEDLSFLSESSNSSSANTGFLLHEFVLTFLLLFGLPCVPKTAFMGAHYISDCLSKQP